MPVTSRFMQVPSKAIELLKCLDVQHDKPRLDVNTMKPSRVWLATTIASGLFFEWGITYALLDYMNYHVKISMGVTRGQSSLFAFAYYMGYLIGPKTIGSPLVVNCGYRAASVAGMLLVALGSFFTSIGAQRCEFWGMVLAHLVVGLGVATLERAANAYAVNCGPRKGAAQRILFGQSVAGAGSVAGPALAKRFVMDANSSGTRPAPNPLKSGTCLLAEAGVVAGSCSALGSVISFYRWLALVLAGVAVAASALFFRTTWMPEVPVEKSPATTHKKWKVWKHPLCSMRFSRFWGALKSCFFALGCQVCVAQFFMEHMKVNACLSDRQAADMMSLAQGLFVVGRAIAFGLVSAGVVANIRAFKPRYVLLAFLLVATGLTIGSVWAKGAAAVSLSCLVMLFEAPSFPMIYESGTADFAQWSATTEEGVIMSISGGGVLPVFMGILADRVGVANAWMLPGICFAIATVYSCLLNIIPSWRKAVDKAAEEEREGSGESEEEKHVGSVELTAVRTA